MELRLIAFFQTFPFFLFRARVVSFWVAVGGFRQVALHFISLVLFLRSQQPRREHKKASVWCDINMAKKKWCFYMVRGFYCFEDLTFRIEGIIQSTFMIIPPGLPHNFILFLTVIWSRIEFLSLFSIFHSSLYIFFITPP